MRWNSGSFWMQFPVLYSHSVMLNFMNIMEGSCLSRSICINERTKSTSCCTGGSLAHSPDLREKHSVKVWLACTSVWNSRVISSMAPGKVHRMQGTCKEQSLHWQLQFLHSAESEDCYLCASMGIHISPKACRSMGHYPHSTLAKWANTASLE